MDRVILSQLQKHFGYPLGVEGFWRRQKYRTEKHYGDSWNGSLAILEEGRVLETLRCDAILVQRAVKVAAAELPGWWRYGSGRLREILELTARPTQP